MLAKLKARMEAKDAATRHPLGIKVRAPGALRSAGGTDWAARDPGAPVGGKFVHMNTAQFNQHLGGDDD